MHHRASTISCSAAGVQTIRDDIEKEAVTHVMIAACSRRAKTEAFQFPTVALARANIREGVIWSQPDTRGAKETTQEMADDYVRMGCGEVKRMKLPAGNPDTGHSKRLLVVGGGISGLTAALEASKTGYQVVLVEKSGKLGGWTAELHRRMPFREPYAEPQDTGMAELIRAIGDDANIKVITNAVIAKTDGAPGRFKVDISVESGPSLTEEVGAIIQATGFTTYDIARLPELGGGKSPNVIDQATLERLAKEAASKGQPIRRPADGGEVKTVVFVQCAGQRDESGTHLAYCSGFCCGASIKQAMYFKDANPAVDTVVIYDDLRVPGNGEDFYRSAQRKGVNFTKGKVSSVEAKGGVCEVKFRDLILDEDAAIAAADLVVLATGQVPNSGVNIDIPAEEVAKMEVKPVSILNLTYRQGKDHAATYRRASPTRTSSASPTRRGAPASTRRARCAVPWTSRRRSRTPPAPRSRRSRRWRTPNWAAPRTRARATSPSPSCSSKAAPSASAARWNARSAPSTRTKSATRCSTKAAAGAAAPAWARARCA